VLAANAQLFEDPSVANLTPNHLLPGASCASLSPLLPLSLLLPPILIHRLTYVLSAFFSAATSHIQQI